MVPIHEPNQVVLNKSIVKGRNEKHSNSNLIFTNKRIEQDDNVIIKKPKEFPHHHKFEFVKLLK